MQPLREGSPSRSDRRGLRRLQTARLASQGHPGQTARLCLDPAPEERPSLPVRHMSRRSAHAADSRFEPLSPVILRTPNLNSKERVQHSGSAGDNCHSARSANKWPSADSNFEVWTGDAAPARVRTTRPTRPKPRTAARPLVRDSALPAELRRPNSSTGLLGPPSCSPGQFPVLVLVVREQANQVVGDRRAQAAGGVPSASGGVTSDGRESIVASRDVMEGRNMLHVTGAQLV